MAIKVKSVDQTASKYVTRASAASPDYLTGVQNPRLDQAQASIAAKDTWAAGVNQAIAQNRYASSIAAKGSTKWQANSAGKGAQRYATGVQGAKGDYAKGVQPYIDVLSNLTLPPRGPKGSPENNNRVATVTQALRARKLQG